MPCLIDMHAHPLTRRVSPPAWEVTVTGACRYTYPLTSNFRFRAIICVCLFCARADESLLDEVPDLQTADTQLADASLEDSCPYELEIVLTPTSGWTQQNASSHRAVNAFTDLAAGMIDASEILVVSFVKVLKQRVDKPALLSARFMSAESRDKVCNGFSGGQATVEGFRVSANVPVFRPPREDVQPGMRYGFKGLRFAINTLPGFSDTQMINQLVESADLDITHMLSYGMHMVKKPGQAAYSNGTVEFYMDPLVAIENDHGSQLQAEDGWPTVQITQPPQSLLWHCEGKHYHRLVRKVGHCQWCWGPRHETGVICAYSGICRQCLHKTDTLYKHSCACGILTVPKEDTVRGPKKRVYDPGMPPSAPKEQSPAQKKRKQRQEKKMEAIRKQFLDAEQNAPVPELPTDYQPRKARRTDSQSPARSTATQSDVVVAETVADAEQ